jgi:hypothetical protein
LLEVLQVLDFEQIWRDIISGMLGSSTKVLLNGVPGKIILHKMGLRQGDPLSPMFFILVMDVLGGMVSKAEEEGVLQPLSTRVLQYRIFLYADDVVFFLHPRESDIQMVLGILHLFGEALGSKNNVHKSSVYSICCGEQEVEVLQEQLPCELSTFTCKYLGLPLSLKKLTRNLVSQGARHKPLKQGGA